MLGSVEAPGTWPAVPNVWGLMNAQRINRYPSTLPALERGLRFSLASVARAQLGDLFGLQAQ